MRRVSILIGLCVLVALGLSVAAAPQQDLDGLMKQVGPTSRALNMDVMKKDGAATAQDADKLEGLFKEVSAFFKSKNMQDGTEWANSAATAAADAAKAAKADNFEAASAATKTIGGTCKSCHEVHREQLPDKTFKLKP